MDTLAERVFYGIAGAFLGAFSVASAIYFYLDTDQFPWPFVAIAAAVGFLLAVLGGSRAIELLKEIWWWS